MSKVCAVLVVLVVLAVGCAGSDDEEAGSSSTTPSSTTSTSAATTTTLFEPGATYVALGTSYAAGQGVQPQQANCGRSDRDYPHLVADALDLELVDVTCGAASTEHLIDTPQGTTEGDVPPQIDAVTADTALVTVTTGGNDVRYSPTAIVCGDPTNVCTRDQAELDSQFTGLRGELTTLFQALHEKAPGATIVLVPYVRLVFDDPCPALSFTPAESDLVQSIAVRLHDLSLEVAEAEDVRVADPWAEEGDHGPCAEGDAAWVDGATATTGFMYHPTAAGHVAMARLVQEELES